MQEDSRTDLGCFLGLDQRRKRCGTHTYKPNGKCDRVAEDMMLNLVKAVILYSMDLVFWNEELCEAQEKENCLFTFLW